VSVAAKQHLQQHLKLAQQRQVAQAQGLRENEKQGNTEFKGALLIEQLSQEVVVLMASSPQVLQAVGPALKSSADTEVGG
jgi:hypothetical protein